MGCYGIGVGRTLQAIIEKFHDEKGIIWPMNIAPFKVEVIPINTSDEEIVSSAQKMHDELENSGIETLLDDRTDLSAGEKFNDADLIGIPLQVIVGRSLKKEGKFEVKIRSTNERFTLNFDETVKFIKEKIRE
jgi:prolyl-tRNA synthetase